MHILHPIPMDTLNQDLYKAVEQCRSAQQQSQQCRKRAEELIAQAERLFTKLGLAKQGMAIRAANKEMSPRGTLPKKG